MKKLRKWFWKWVGDALWSWHCRLETWVELVEHRMFMVDYVSKPPSEFDLTLIEVFKAYYDQAATTSLSKDAFLLGKVDVMKKFQNISGRYVYKIEGGAKGAEVSQEAGSDRGGQVERQQLR